MMNEVSPQLRAMLETSPHWDGSGIITLQPHWAPLKDLAKDAPMETGIYALGLPVSVKYQSGSSRVFYIGSSESLRDRLHTHATTSHNATIAELKERFGPQLVGCYWLFPDLPTKWLRTIEGETLWAFEHTFGTVPLANLDIPESKLKDGYTGLVSVIACPVTVDSLTLDQLAERCGCVAKVKETAIRGNPSQGISFSLGIDINGNLTVIGRYRAVYFIPRDVDERQKQNALDSLCWVKREHVGAWSVEKMKGVIEVCRALKPLKVKAKTIREYEAVSREVPHPHTWGEVSLVQGRIVNGAWRTATGKLWIKVLHKGELLGLAKLFTYWCEGFDESDKPQSQSPRPSYYVVCESSPAPRLQESDYIKVSEEETIDEDTGSVIRAEPTPEAMERHKREWEEYTQQGEQALWDTLEETFERANGSLKPTR